MTATQFGKEVEHSGVGLFRLNQRSCLHVDVFLPSSQLLTLATALQIRALPQAGAVREFGSSSSPGVKAEEGAALSTLVARKNIYSEPQMLMSQVRF